MAREDRTHCHLEGPGSRQANGSAAQYLEGCRTAYDIPVFFDADGHVSVFMVREIMNAAFRELGQDFTPEQIDAIDIFRATAAALRADQPGGGFRLRGSRLCEINVSSCFAAPDPAAIARLV